MTLKTRATLPNDRLTMESSLGHWAVIAGVKYSVKGFLVVVLLFAFQLFMDWPSPYISY